MALKAPVFQPRALSFFLSLADFRMTLCLHRGLGGPNCASRLGDWSGTVLALQGLAILGVAAGWWRHAPTLEHVFQRWRVSRGGRRDHRPGAKSAAMACCTATEGMHNHLRAQPDLAARRTAGGARYARTRTRSGTKCTTVPSAPHLRPTFDEALRPSYRKPATLSAAPSTSALHGCGWRTRTGLASQHNAIPVGVAP